MSPQPTTAPVSRSRVASPGAQPADAPVPSRPCPSPPQPLPAADRPFSTLESPGGYTNLVEIFDEGFRRAGDAPFLGHRPLVSAHRGPPAYARRHVWQSWPAVDARRRALGSALHALFGGGVLGGRVYASGIGARSCAGVDGLGGGLSAEVNTSTSSLHAR